MDLNPPLPINAVYWNNGWASSSNLTKKKFAEFANLQKQRQVATLSLFHDNDELVCEKMFAYANAVKQDIVLARQLSVNPRRIWPLDFEWCFPNELEKNGRVASMRSCYPAFECMCSYMAGICCKVRHILSLDHTATLSQLRGLHRAAESEAYTNNVICKLKDAVTF